MSNGLSEADVQLLQAFADECIIGPNQAMTAKAIYEKVAERLESDISASSFPAAMSNLVKEGKIAGIMGKRRVGYCRLETKPDPVPARVPELPNCLPLQYPKPAVKANARHIWVGRKLFRLMTTFDRLEELVIAVLGGTKNESGQIVFNGKRYDCDVSLFERTLKFLGAWTEGESDPVLDDGSGIPVQFRIES